MTKRAIKWWIIMALLVLPLLFLTMCFAFLVNVPMHFACAFSMQTMNAEYGRKRRGLLLWPLLSHHLFKLLHGSFLFYCIHQRDNQHNCTRANHPQRRTEK